MPKFNTTIADKTQSVQYVVKPDNSLCIITITGKVFHNMRQGQIDAVMHRIRSECWQHHEGTLFASQRGES